MLVQALQSSPNIRCFRELFNWQQNFIDFQMGGYDNFSEQDRARRERDPIRFLQERIFCQHPEEIRAVGFKLLYPHVWGFPGLLKHLVEDTEIRVLHLQRRNSLRALVSLKIAQTTGVWLERGEPKPTLTGVLRAPRHPLRAAARLATLLRLAKRARKAPRVRVTVSEEELFKFIIQAELTARHFEELFREHPKLTVFYEEILDRRNEVFRRAQAFLGVEPAPLTVGLRRQNPYPLRKLIENYDELYEAYRATPHAALFE